MLKKTAIIVSASSDIGQAMAERWLAAGWAVFGTYRNKTASHDLLATKGLHWIPCDLLDKGSVEKACKQLNQASARWDALVLAPGVQDPVGPFHEVDFDAWAGSVEVNFTQQLRMVHRLLPSRNLDSTSGPTVLFFAGGGTNNAVVDYSAYTVSKIALIKMCELLDAEIPDTKFTILGPGWVKTKIHESTLKAGNKAGVNYQRTLEKLSSGECTPMQSVMACCDWLVDSERSVVSGRNFSVVYDNWGSDEFKQALSTNQNLFKLRRSGNDLEELRRQS